jgi:hypothetical protein
MTLAQIAYEQFKTLPDDQAKEVLDFIGYLKSKYPQDSHMELSISDEKTKELLTEVVIDLLKTKRNVMREIMLEALEEVGLANAIAEGRKDEFVSEDEILSILDGNTK